MHALRDQQGYRQHQVGIEGLLGSVGGQRPWGSIRECRVSGVYWGPSRVCRCSGPSGVLGALGLLGGVGGVREHLWPSGGVGGQGCIGAGKECRCSGASRGIGSIKGHWGS